MGVPAIGLELGLAGFEEIQTKDNHLLIEDIQVILGIKELRNMIRKLQRYEKALSHALLKDLITK